MDEAQYLWEHFKCNSEQRLKGFNFFVLLSIFANGGVFTAIDKHFNSWLLFMIGCSILILSVVFLIVDIRSRRLLHLTALGMKKIEEKFSDESRLFQKDAKKRGRLIRYTFAFHELITLEMFFGIGIAIYYCPFIW